MQAGDRNPALLLATAGTEGIKETSQTTMEEIVKRVFEAQ